VAGAYGGASVTAKSGGSLNPINLLAELMGEGTANTILILLAISSFPPVCFSAFIAANSFRTTLPKVNPWLSVGCGTAVAIILAVTGVVGKVIFVFVVIGASFGPVCGAMAADYLLSGRKWAGPRAGWNPAGWISWIIGFAVGAVDFIAGIPGLEGLKGSVPAPPVAAFVVGFVLYLILAKIGLTTRVIEMPAAAESS
jgi:cytosine permease